MYPLCFRETGTQTSNNFDAALEMVRNTMQQTSISNDPSYFNLNKPQGYEMLENFFHTHRTSFYKRKSTVKDQDLESHSTLSSSKIDAVSSSSIETERADQVLPISYKCCNANTTPYSSPYWFIDDGSWKNLDPQYYDLDTYSGVATVLDESYNDDYITNAVSHETKTETASKYNIGENRFKMSKPLQESTMQAASTINHGDKDSHSSFPPQKLDYLELHTHNPQMGKFTILPVKLPSPLITSIIPGRHLKTSQDNPDSITRSSCNQKLIENTKYTSHPSCQLDTKLRYNDDLGSYQLERCQFTIKGVDGLTRNAKVDFTTSGNRS